MVVPLVIVAVGVYFAYAPFGLSGSLVGLTLAHTALAAPFVVITVSATLQGFDANQARAGASLGASPTVVFRRIVLPLILPGVISGALFAFVTSFDEVVVALFLTGPGRAHAAAPDVHGHAREHQPGDHRRREPPDPPLGAAVDGARAASSSQRAPARNPGLRAYASPPERPVGTLSASARLT